MFFMSDLLKLLETVGFISSNSDFLITKLVLLGMPEKLRDGGSSLLLCCFQE